MLSDQTLLDATGEGAGVTFMVDGLDIASGTSAPRILSFLDDERFADDAKQNSHVVAILTTRELAQTIEWPSRITVVPVDDPRWSFYTLHNAIVAAREALPASQIDASARVSPLAFIADRGVHVGAGCVVEPFAALHEGTRLLDHAVVRTNAVVGNIGFEHKRTKRGVLSVLHDGGVTIGERSEIGAHCNIAQGFARKQTLIGRDVRVDSMTHIAHGCQIGDEALIAAGVTLSGSVKVGERAWIGPGATVRDQIRVGADSRVAIGALVLRDVADGARVAGSPARAQP